MAVKLLRPFNGDKVGAIVSLGAATETALVNSLGATYDLSGGVVDKFNPPFVVVDIVGEAYPVSTPLMAAPVALAMNGAVKLYWATGPRGAPSKYIVIANQSSPRYLEVSPSKKYRQTAYFNGLTNGQSCFFVIMAIYEDGRVFSSLPSNTVTPVALNSTYQIDSLMAWWDASQIPGPPSGGAAISSWPDASGSGWTATQSTGTRQPTFTANWLASGRPAVTFDGQGTTGGDLMNTGLTQGMIGPEMTAICVYSMTALTNGSGVRDQRIFTGEQTTYDRGFTLCSNNSNQLGGSGSSAITVKGATKEINAGILPVVNTIYVVSIVTGAQFFVNGARQAPQWAGICQVIPHNQGLTLAGLPNNSGNSNLSGSIAELLIYNRRLTDVQRWAIEAALCAKYGLAAPPQEPTL